MEEQDLFDGIDPGVVESMVPDHMTKAVFMANCRGVYSSGRFKSWDPLDLIAFHSIGWQMDPAEITAHFEDDKIVELKVEQPNGRHHDFATGVRHLRHLRLLFIVGDINVERLASLPQLVSLFIKIHPPFGFNESHDAHNPTAFDSLKTLAVCSPNLMYLASRCVALQIFVITCTNCKEIGEALDNLEALASSELPVVKSLQDIGLSSNRDIEVKPDHLVKLFLSIIPKFPNLTSLLLSPNFSSLGFDSIAKRISDDNTGRVSTSLRELKFIPLGSDTDATVSAHEHPKMDDADWMKSVHSFLGIFDTITNVDFGLVPKNPGLEYELVKNMVGRKIVQADLPPAIWPILLERVPKRVEKECRIHKWEPSRVSAAKASGIYYLLREGKVPIGRQNGARTQSDELSAANQEGV